MTDLPKELANEEVVNPFISLKKILEDINRDSIGELVTEIETNGIFAYDDINRLRKYTVESGTKAAQAIELIVNFYNYDPYYYQDRGNSEYVLSPLDSVQNPEWHLYPNLPNVPSEYNYYGWLKSDLPDFKAMPVGLNKDKPLGQKSELSYQRIIAALLEYIEGHAPNIDPHPNFTTEAKLIEYLAGSYKGYEGLSQSNLSRKFPEAKRTLKES